MKVNQIVGEHKKGFRANIYRKKKQVEPKSTEIKPMEEDAKITRSDQTGVEITAADGVKTILPPDKASALAPDPQNPNEYDLNPAAINPSANASSGPSAPKVGSTVDMKTAEASEESLGTMPTTEYVKGIYAAAAENGMGAPEVDAVKKQMVLAPNGEVDIMKTMQKALQVFQSPELKQLMADLEALIKQGEAQQASNPELGRIQELAGIADEDRTSPRFAGLSQTDHDNGDVTQDYSAGPMSVSQRKDKTGKEISMKAQYNLGLGKLGMEREKGITSKSWAPSAHAVGDDPISQKDLYAMGNADKEATYDRAMAQVNTATKEQMPEPTKSGPPMSFDDLVKTVQQGGKVNAVPTAQPTTPQQDLDQYKKDYMARWNALSPEEKARANQREGVNEQRVSDNQLLAKMLSIAGLR